MYLMVRLQQLMTDFLSVSRFFVSLQKSNRMDCLINKEV